MDINNTRPQNPVERIRVQLNSFSRTQKKIANLLLEKGEEVCFMSLSELSSTVGVTPVTIMSFCRRLGYGGFSNFKKEFQIYIQTMISPRKVVRENVENYQGCSESNIIAKMIADEAGLLANTYQSISSETLVRAVDMLDSARRVYLVGRGLSMPVAEIFLTRLDFLCVDAQILSISNKNLLANRLSEVNENDLFVIFSFPNYTETMGEIAQCAKFLKSQIICITDKPTSPSACYADVLLLCQTSSFIYYNSMTAPLSLITILASLLAVRKNKTLEAKKVHLEKISAFFRER